MFFIHLNFILGNVIFKKGLLKTSFDLRLAVMVMEVQVLSYRPKPHKKTAAYGWLFFSEAWGVVVN